MADIEIEGLNHKQRGLADIIWACESKESVLSFIDSLSGQNKKDAKLVLELMTLAVWDNIDTVEPEVAELINSYK